MYSFDENQSIHKSIVLLWNLTARFVGLSQPFKIRDLSVVCVCVCRTRRTKEQIEIVRATEGVILNCEGRKHTGPLSSVARVAFTDQYDECWTSVGLRQRERQRPGRLSHTH